MKLVWLAASCFTRFSKPSSPSPSSMGCTATWCNKSTIDCSAFALEDTLLQERFVLRNPPIRCVAVHVAPPHLLATVRRTPEIILSDLPQSSAKLVATVNVREEDGRPISACVPYEHLVRTSLAFRYPALVTHMAGLDLLCDDVFGTSVRIVTTREE